MTKMLSASGGFAPWPSDQGLCPWTPRYTIVLRSRHGRGLPPATHPPSATYDPRASSPPTYFDKFTPMLSGFGFACTGWARGSGGYGGSCLQLLRGERRPCYPALQNPTTSLVFHDQFAFRPWGSTTAAIITLLHKVTHLLMTNPYVIVIAIDFSKAFNTIRHHTLLDKIAQLDLPDHIHNWLVNFFNGILTRQNMKMQCPPLNQYQQV